MSILKSISGVYNNTININDKSHYRSRFNEYFERSYFTFDAIYRLKDIQNWSEFIDLSLLQTKSDSLRNLGIEIANMNISDSKKDSLFSQVINNFIELYDKQHDMKAEFQTKRWDKITHLYGLRMMFYGFFVLSQIYGLILLGYSQFMKDKIETPKITKSKN